VRTLNSRSAKADYERSFVTTADGTIERRDERHAAMLNEALKVIAEVGGQLLVEPAARPVREAFSDLRRAFDRCRIAEELEPAGTDRATKIRELEQDVARLSLEVQSMAEARLAELDAPPALG
jgi:hypothetical protein